VKLFTTIFSPLSKPYYWNLIAASQFFELEVDVSVVPLKKPTTKSIIPFTVRI